MNITLNNDIKGKILILAAVEKELSADFIKTVLLPLIIVRMNLMRHRIVLKNVLWMQKVLIFRILLLIP